MVITRTPFRMSFFGGGTDFPDFYNVHGGAVISTTFDKFCFLTVRHLPRFFDYTSEFVYSQIERVTDSADIRHPAIKAAMDMLDMREIRLTYDADLPARTGLGTSSSFAVGMLSAFYALKGKHVDKRRLADDAIYLERVLCSEAGGVQDQIAASFGGLNRINFSEHGYTVQPITVSRERKQQLNDSLMLFYSGIPRLSCEVQAKTMQALDDKKAQLLEMLQLVEEAEKTLCGKGSLDEFGRLLDDSWKLKRGVTDSISSDTIDEIYSKAMHAGAIGGKLLGAGGGGFLLFYVPQDRKANVKRALEPLLHVPFAFEEEGTATVYYSAEDYDLSNVDGENL